MNTSRPVAQAIAYSALSLFALFYYASYYDVGFNLWDEGYLYYVIQRLSAGAIPYVDITQGYGVLWYYPIVLCCKIFGETYNVIRICLFFQSFLTAALTLHIVWRVTKSVVWAFFFALCVLVLHSVIDKTMIPLCVAGICALYLHPRALWPLSRRFCFMAGFFFMLIYLIRPEYGWVSMAWAFAIPVWAGARSRRIDGAILQSVAFIAGGAALVLAVFLGVAAHFGFAGAFFRQESSVFLYCFHLIFPVHTAPAIAPVATAAAPAAASSAAATDSGTLARVAASGIFVCWDTFVHAIVTWGTPFFLLTSLITAFLRERGRAAGTLPYCWHVLVVAVALSPSFFAFFFFRPDMSHFSQLAPSLFIMLAVVGYRGVTVIRRMGEPLLNKIFIPLAFVCGAAVVSIYAYDVFRTMDRTPRVLKIATERVAIPGKFISRTIPEEADIIRSVVDAIEKNSKPGDSIGVYPYLPGAYALTGRRSYNPFVYCDDTTARNNPGFIDGQIEKITDVKPPVIVVQDWPINGVDASRFSVWAARIMEYVQAHYFKVYDARHIAVYVRNDGAAGAS